MSMEQAQLLLSVANVLGIVPALVGIGRWLMRIELRLARIEWANGQTKEAA